MYVTVPSGVNVPLIVAGTLALLGAALHGAGGELWVVRKLSREMLPSTRLGGQGMTQAMIHAAWHLTTVGFLTVGVALVLAGSVVDDGDTARGIGLVCAAAATGFAAVVVGLGLAHLRGARSLLLHPAPAVLTATAALAWWGAL
jgi:hypothetical protein